jgi:prevent-host-death family protein
MVMKGHMMQEKTVMASTFKARCLALLDQVEIDRVPLVITKRGRAIARVVPMDEAPTGRSTMGSVRLVADADAAYYGTDEIWEAETAG